MKCQLFLGLSLSILAAMAGCRASEQGTVGVDYEQSTPLGTFKGKAGLKWDFSAPDASWNGCITWIGEDGKPLAGAPKGKIENGKGSGVVPAGAAGWSVEVSDEDAPDCEDNESPPQATAPTYRYFFVGHLQGINYTDTALQGDGRVYDYSLEIHATSYQHALDLRNQVIDERELGSLPAGVEIFHLVDLMPSFDTLGTFQGFSGEFIQDAPVDMLKVAANGQLATAHSTPAVYQGNGYWSYPVTVPLAQLNHSTSNVATTNELSTVWRDASGVTRYAVDFTWAPR